MAEYSLKSRILIQKASSLQVADTGVDMIDINGLVTFSRISIIFTCVKSLEM